MKILSTTAKLLLVTGLIIFPMRVRAQSSPASSSSPSSSLSDQEVRGKVLFLQRCSICHLPKMTKAKSDALPLVGPILKDLFKNANPEKEAAVRQLILKGGPNMPAFQYGLKSKEIDNLIAYLKTL